MAFSIIGNDFFDYFRFFYDKVTFISDFFEETGLKKYENWIFSIQAMII